jgi:hypothetical protein
MTKKRIEGGGSSEEPKKPAGKKLHLHEIRSTAAHDGTYTHHHTYKDSKEAPFSHPERGPMATSANAEEAGQHVAEQFGMNEQAAPAEAEPAEAGAPAAGQGAAPAPQE